MNKNVIFIIVSVVLLSLAGVLTWTLLAPEQSNKFYESAFGISVHKPTSEAVGNVNIQFQKTEE